MMVGREATASAGTVTMVASRAEAYARALTRSAGMKLRPTLGSARSALSTLTSGAGSASTVTLPSASA